MTKSEIRKAWVAKLRSGEYKQASSRLRTIDNRFCCLGVLCELAVEEGIIQPATLGPEGYEYGKDEMSPVTAVPPPKVVEWVGLGNKWGKFSNEFPYDLTVANDSKFTFEHIAGLIETEPGLWAENQSSLTPDSGSCTTESAGKRQEEN